MAKSDTHFDCRLRDARAVLSKCGSALERVRLYTSSERTRLPKCEVLLSRLCLCLICPVCLPAFQLRFRTPRPAGTPAYKATHGLFGRRCGCQVVTRHTTCITVLLVSCTVYVDPLARRGCPLDQLNCCQPCVSGSSSIGRCVRFST
jgi:hypothetical protein